MSQTVTQGITAVLASQTGVAIVLPPHPIAPDNAVSGIPLDGVTLLASRGRHANLVLQDGDVLVVPKCPTVVTVLGAVARSGAVPSVAGKNVGYYLGSAGDLREDADVRHIIVVHDNGGAMAAGMHTPIRAGDVIVVPSQYVVRNVRVVSMVEQWLNTIVPLVTSALIVKTTG
jgi:protein involved in polysaccharide export with SLBB domain